MNNAFDLYYVRKENLAQMTTSTLFNSLEDERSFRELSFKWSIAWDKKVFTLT